MAKIIGDLQNITRSTDMLLSALIAKVKIEPITYALKCK
jgi:hypothetical protein